MATVEVNDTTFESTVLQADRPVLVDFWATWCAPCRMVAPVLEELSEEYAQELVVAKLDVDRAPVTAQRFGIRSIPTLMIFDNGEVKQAVQGALPKPALMELIEKALPAAGGHRITVAELAQRFESGLPTVVFDVRPESDFHRGHIRGSKSMDADGLAVAIDAAEGMVILVDRAGAAAEPLAKQHNQPGLEVRALQGGLLEWEGEGHPTYSTQEEQSAAG